MAVPRMRDEGWPGWAKTFFVLLGIVLIVAGVAQIVQSRHGEWLLGLLAVLVGVGTLVGWLIRPRWINDPS